MGALGIQLPQMNVRQTVQQFLPPAGNAQANAAAVMAIMGALQQPFLFAAVHQLDGAVMLQTQPLRRIGNGGTDTGRCARDSEQQLLLLRVEPLTDSGIFTGKQENTQLMAKFGQRSMERLIGIVDAGAIRGHGKIVS